MKERIEALIRDLEEQAVKCEEKSKNYHPWSARDGMEYYRSIGAAAGYRNSILSIREFLLSDDESGKSEEVEK